MPGRSFVRRHPGIILAIKAHQVHAGRASGEQAEVEIAERRGLLRPDFAVKPK
jgi:hypothetical protein